MKRMPYTDLDDTLSVRNELLHVNLLSMIKQGHFHNLTKSLHDDFCNIPKVVWALEDNQLDIMMKLLEMMLNLWFDCDEDNPGNMQMWIPSEQLKEYYKGLRGPDAHSEAEINHGMPDAIMQSIQKQCRNSQREREMISMVEINFGLATEVRKTQRIASSQLLKKPSRAQKRNKNRTKL